MLSVVSTVRSLVGIFCSGSTLCGTIGFAVLSGIFGVLIAGISGLSGAMKPFSLPSSAYQVPPSLCHIRPLFPIAVFESVRVT